MDSLAKQKFRALAKSHGWSIAQAEGFVDGQTVRRRGKMPSKYALVGIDEYCAGFRAGYFDRQNLESHAAGSGRTPDGDPERARQI